MFDKNKMILNDRIIASNILLIGEDGKNYGVVPIDIAKNIADEKRLDLLQVSHKCVPTCKLIDYGKFLYEHSKKIKKHKTPTVKGMRTSLGIDKHDLNFKHVQVRKFLEKGNRVIYTLILEGREKGKLSEAISLFYERLSEFSDICGWKKHNMGHSRKKITISITLNPKNQKH